MALGLAGIFLDVDAGEGILEAVVLDRVLDFVLVEVGTAGFLATPEPGVTLPPKTKLYGH